jgi:proteasome lid subunit RPN8/RPN11
LLEQTYEQLVQCGQGTRECVGYWLGPTDDAEVVRRIVHPLHRSGPFGYEVDSGYVNELFLDLRRTRETVRLQVHTHPEEASHSGVDDAFALAPSTGFLSLVIPDFALGPPDLARCHLVEMQPDGEWLEIEAGKTLVLV